MFIQTMSVLILNHLLQSETMKRRIISQILYYTTSAGLLTAFYTLLPEKMIYSILYVLGLFSSAYMIGGMVAWSIKKIMYKK